jgi:hypothetical protein
MRKRALPREATYPAKALNLQSTHPANGAYSLSKRDCKDTTFF